MILSLPTWSFLNVVLSFVAFYNLTKIRALYSQGTTELQRCSLWALSKLNIQSVISPLHCQTKIKAKADSNSTYQTSQRELSSQSSCSADWNDNWWTLNIRISIIAKVKSWKEWGENHQKVSKRRKVFLLPKRKQKKNNHTIVKTKPWTRHILGVLYPPWPSVLRQLLRGLWEVTWRAARETSLLLFSIHSCALSTLWLRGLCQHSWCTTSQGTSNSSSNFNCFLLNFTAQEEHQPGSWEPGWFIYRSNGSKVWRCQIWHCRVELRWLERARTRGDTSLQPSYRPFVQQFSPQEGLNPAVNHCTSQLLSPYLVARPASQRGWDWPYICTGHGQLQLPLRSDNVVHVHSPSASICPVRQRHLMAPISDKVHHTPKHGLEIAAHMRWWCPGTAPAPAGSPGETFSK